MSRHNILLLTIVIVFLFVLSACSDEASDPQCLGGQALCGGIDCPDSVSYNSAKIQSDGDICSIPADIDTDAASLFNEMLTVFPGTYKNEETGDTVTIECDTDGTLWFPDSGTPCQCAIWYMPFILTFESETVSGGLASYCSTFTQASPAVIKGEASPNSNWDAIGKMRYEENNGRWHLELDNEDGVPVAWRKI